MKRILSILIVIGFNVLINAQSLDECIKLAKEHYPEIRQYDLITQTEQYNFSNAARSWIPQVTLSGQATYQSATPTYPKALNSILQANGVDMVGIRNDQYKIGIDINQKIWDGGQSKANRAIVETEAAEQRSRIEVTLYDLESRINDIYFGILLIDERIAQTNTLIEVLESNLNRMQVYYMNGVAKQSDADVIEAELITAKQSLDQIKFSKASYCHILETFIGQKLTDEKLEQPVMHEITSSTSHRPELFLFEAQNNKLDAQRKAINASLMPQFSVFAQGYYGYPGMDMFKSMVSPQWSLNGIIGVNMSWNIGAFYTKDNNLKKIEIAQKQIAVQRDKFLFNTEIQSIQEQNEIARIRKLIIDDERIVDLRHRIRLVAESQLKNGIIDATDLLRKITDESAATINLSTHKIELLQATYKLKTTLNH